MYLEGNNLNAMNSNHQDKLLQFAHAKSVTYTDLKD